MKRENEKFKKEIDKLRLDLDRLFIAQHGDRRPDSTDAAGESSTHSESASSPPVVDVNTDTFATSNPWRSPLAMSSLISVLRSYVGGSSDSNARPQPSLNETSTLFITLPPPETLQSLVNSFFHQFDCYFPCLDRVNFKKRVAEAFKNLSYSKTNQRVSVGVQHYKTMAILCSVLAFGAPFVTPIDTSEKRPGWTQYLQGKQLMQSIEISG